MTTAAAQSHQFAPVHSISFNNVTPHRARRAAQLHARAREGTLRAQSRSRSFSTVRQFFGASAVAG
jgi:hypothetical protein